jgi:hypothetical protein
MPVKVRVMTDGRRGIYGPMIPVNMKETVMQAGMIRGSIHHGGRYDDTGK